MDEQITALILAGEHQTALHQLATAYTTPLLRLCIGLVGTQAEAEELMQETYIQAWEAMSGFRAESTARAWLFGIARRLCMRHQKRKQRRHSLWKRWLLGQFATQKKAIVSPEDTTILGQVLSTLKPTLREAVLLRYQLDCDHREIAAILQIKPDAARKRVSLGIQALRRTFQEADRDPISLEASLRETSPGIPSIGPKHSPQERHTPPSLPAFLPPQQIEQRLVKTTREHTPHADAGTPS